MTHASCAGCTEYQEWTRRRFLTATGAAAAAAAIAPAWLPRVSLAQDHRGAQRDVLVVIFLRGGMDGLAMCPPHAADEYYAARPTLNVPRPDSGSPDAAINLDGFFGFHPAMAPLMPAYQDGKLLVVHAAGSTYETRSHFDGERIMEFGAGGGPVSSGWMARHLATVSPLTPDAPLRGVGLRADLQFSLTGAEKSLPIPQLGSFNLAGSFSTAQARENWLQWLHDSGADEPLRTNALNSIETLRLLRTINFGGYAPAGGAVYPGTGMAYTMRSVAALIKAQVGVETIAVDLGGWDHHANEGVFTGIFNSLLTQLAGALGPFYRDMTAGVAPSFTLCVMSEFGRRVDENGSGGTDHGHGNAMLVMGNCVNGGRVLTQWPGLAPEQLYQGIDLAVTTDYRDILSEIVQSRLGNPNLAEVFPGYTPNFRGVLSC